MSSEENVMKKPKVSMRARVQAFGGFLTNMVLPNIGAFIAWGILTALFIPTGWLPNEKFASMVGPVITYVLPLLLAYTGGRMVGGQRGAIMGSLGAIGLIVGSDIPMFLGAMIVGPLGGWLIKKFDSLLDGKIPTGFEMVINNFSLGIIGFLFMMVSFSLIGNVIVAANDFVVNIIGKVVATGMLPLLSLINEPAKVLFLNNVIDQGMYYPLGMQETLEKGKSIFFMVASNPGPGLGLLLAYTFFGQKTARQTAPGAIIIHFFGGIHELYFPYVLMKPVTIIAMILGAMSGILVFQTLGVGLVAGPSPGSIFAYLALTPKGNFLGVISGVALSTVVSFLVTSLILKVSKKTEEDFEASFEKSKQMKAEGQGVLIGKEALSKAIYKVSFACDAGVGSSAFGATAFGKKVKEHGIKGIEVKNYNIEEIPSDSDVIVVHKNLKERTVLSHPDKNIVTLENYLQDPSLEQLLDELKKRDI